MVEWLTLALVPHVCEVWSLHPVSAKPYIALQTVHHRLNFYASSVLPWRYAAEMSTANRYRLVGVNTTSIMKDLEIGLVQYN